MPKETHLEKKILTKFILKKSTTTTTKTRNNEEENETHVTVKSFTKKI